MLLPQSDFANASSDMKRPRRSSAWMMLLLLSVVGLAAFLYRPDIPPAKGHTDVEVLYQQVVAQLRNSGSYYPVLRDQLRKSGYATLELFHWRTPLLLNSLALLPDQVSHALLIIVGVTLYLLTFAVTVTRGPFVFWAAMVMQLGTVALVINPKAIFVAEIWAGFLIALSVCASLVGRTIPAVVLGLMALFVRELAAPYCVVATLYAVWQRRWSEVRLWAAGAVAYAIYFGMHVVNVWAHQGTEARSAGSWLVLGGFPFLLSTIYTHVWVWMIAPVGTVIACMLLVAGILSPATPPVVRLTSAAYCLLFVLAGKHFDHYWGLVVWPTWVFALGWGLEMVRRDISIVARATELRQSITNP
jgi:hypothetical protein